MVINQNNTLFSTKRVTKFYDTVLYTRQSLKMIKILIYFFQYTADTVNATIFH